LQKKKRRQLGQNILLKIQILLLSSKDYLNYFYNKDYESNNILNSIFYGEKVINGNIIIAYSDILFESNVVQRLLDSDHDISIVVDIDWRGYYVDREGHPIEEAEKVIFNSNNEVINSFIYIFIFFCWTFLIVSTLTLLFDTQRSIVQSLLSFL